LTKKILITPKSYYRIREKMVPLLKNYEVKFNETGKTFTEEQMIELAEDVDGIIIGVDPTTKNVINNASKLKAISKYGVGMDNIDIDAAKKNNIKIKKTPGTNNISVAELTIGLMFDLSRNITNSVQRVRNKKWQRAKGIELTGKTLGIIGCGDIGKEVVIRAIGLKMNVIINDPYFNKDDLLGNKNIRLVNKDYLLENADFISLHLPLNSETENIIGLKEFKQMNKKTFLINTARGGLVNEKELIWSLKNDEIAGAGFDVFSAEPPKDETILKLENFLLTPHMGANTKESVIRMAEMATKNIINMLDN